MAEKIKWPFLSDKWLQKTQINKRSSLKAQVLNRFENLDLKNSLSRDLPKINLHKSSVRLCNSNFKGTVNLDYVKEAVNNSLTRVLPIDQFKSYMTTCGCWSWQIIFTCIGRISCTYFSIVSVKTNPERFHLTCNWNKS